jgi:hypothetical protein
MTDTIGGPVQEVTATIEKPKGNLDLVCLILIGILALADLGAVGLLHVPLDTVAELSGPIIAGLMAFLKGS